MTGPDTSRGTPSAGPQSPVADNSARLGPHRKSSNPLTQLTKPGTAAHPSEHAVLRAGAGSGWVAGCWNTGGMDDRLRHTPEERDAALAAIRSIRANLTTPPPVSAVPEPGRERPPVEPPLEDRDRARMEVEMAWGAERSRLEARVNELEIEVTRLRRALAAILRHAANAVTDPTDPTIDPGPG